MANSKQIKSLVLAHFDKDGEKFRTTVLQIAANEAKNGHTKFAKELKDIIQNSKRNSLRRENISNDQLELLQFSIPNTKLSELVVNDNLRNRIKRIIKENKQKENLLSYGLQSRRKILIEGPSGTGKTMTSRIIASELNYPLYTIQMDKLVTKFMGETSIKLRQIFDIISENEGVYLFDEFDAIASERSLENDVGEMRRVLNSFLQFIEQDSQVHIDGGILHDNMRRDLYAGRSKIPDGFNTPGDHQVGYILCMFGGDGNNTDHHFPFGSHSTELIDMKYFDIIDFCTDLRFIRIEGSLYL